MQGAVVSTTLLQLQGYSGLSELQRGEHVKSAHFARF